MTWKINFKKSKKTWTDIPSGRLMIERGILMTEAQNKQISIFDYDDFEEVFKNRDSKSFKEKEDEFKTDNQEGFEAWNNHLRNYLETISDMIINRSEEQDQKSKTDFIKNLRTTMYKSERFYSFSKASSVIQFLIDKEIEGFKYINQLRALINLAYKDIQINSNSIQGPEDLIKKHLQDYQEEFEINKNETFEYIKIIDNDFEALNITSFKDKETFIDYIDEYKKILHEISILESLDEEQFNNIIKHENSWVSFSYHYKENKEESITYFQLLLDKSWNDIEVYLQRFNNKDLNKEELISIIEDIEKKLYEIALFTGNEYFDKDSEVKLSFSNIDYLEGLQMLEAGIYKNDPEGLILLEAINQGLKICVESFFKKESLINNSKNEIETYLKFKKKLPSNDPLNDKINFLVLSLNEDPKEIFTLFTNQGKPKNFVQVSGEAGKMFSSDLSIIEDAVNKPNKPVKVEIQLRRIEDSSIIPGQEYKPIMNALLTYYIYYGTETPFSLIQFYEDFYLTQFHSKQETSKKNIEELERMINDLRFMTARIRITETSEEEATIQERTLKFDDILIPLRRYEASERIFKRASGEIVKASNNVFYKFTSKPIYYEYAQYFGEKNLLKYNREMFLSLPPGTKMLKADNQTILIRDELIKRIILIKQSWKDFKSGKTPKPISKKINTCKFLKDYCGIIYSKEGPKKREKIRNTMAYFLDLFKTNQQIKGFTKKDLDFEIELYE